MPIRLHPSPWHPPPARSAPWAATAEHSDRFRFSAASLAMLGDPSRLALSPTRPSTRTRDVPSPHFPFRIEEYYPCPTRVAGSWEYRKIAPTASSHFGREEPPNSSRLRSPPD